MVLTRGRPEAERHGEQDDIAHSEINVTDGKRGVIPTTDRGPSTQNALMESRAKFEDRLQKPMGVTTRF